jgi:hypothetical protein
LTVADGSFDAGALVFSFSTSTNGTMDVVEEDFGYSNSFPLTGSATNTPGIVASLVETGGVQQLTIPIDAAYPVDSGNLAGTALQLTGQVVATRVIAPPTILSVVVANHTAILTVANATLQSEVEGSTDMETWSAIGATPSDASGLTLFARPMTGHHEFFRIRR